MSGGVFGRDAELSVLEAFLAGLASAPAVLVLAGVAGAGKTTAGIGDGPVVGVQVPLRGPVTGQPVKIITET
jgi:tRNA A37 threonylcarbamoyladenosine biosynthesis protein TsaE